MGDVILNKNKVSEPRPEATTFEAQIAKRIIKENWRNKLDDVDKTNKHYPALLEDHVDRMNKVLSTTDYEILSMPNVIANSKKMTKGELRMYLIYLEALATGYKRRFDSGFTNIILAGLTLKARDLDAMSKHYRLFVNEIEQKLAYYRSVINSKSRDNDAMLLELKYMESSMFRFFKKRKIAQLRGSISTRMKRLRKLEGRLQKRSSVLNELRDKFSIYPENKL